MLPRSIHKPTTFLNTLGIGLLWIAITVRFCGMASAEEKLTGKPWIDMNYGPYATASFETHKDNIAYKGIAIRLDEGQGGVSFGERFVVFDTDTMRYGAAWTGKGFINWRSIVYDGSHGTHPSIVGERTYVNPVGPGWGHPEDGRFDDERLRGHDDKPYGPLDRKWAKWRGLYTHGDQILLSFQVGDAQILEHPSLVTHNGSTAFARTLQIGPRDKDLIVQVAAPRDKEIQVKDNIATAGAVESKTTGKPTTNAFAFDGASSLEIATAKQLPLMRQDFTVYARIRTKHGGTILAEAPEQGDWQADGKTFFVKDGRVTFDIGWVGNVQSKNSVADGKWHDVAMTYDMASSQVALFVDGTKSGNGKLKPKSTPDDFVLRVGYTSPNFPAPTGFVGDISDVRAFRGKLPAEQLTETGIRGVDKKQLLGHWRPTETKGGKLADESGHEHVAAAKQQAAGTPGGGDGAAGPIAAAFKDAPAGTKWLSGEEADGNLRVKVPAGSKTVTMQILVGQLSDDQTQDAFAALVKSTSTKQLTELSKGGPARWTESVTTEIGTLGDQDGSYAVDVLTTPAENPYRSWMRLGGFDFFADKSRAAVCTWMGDVWIVEGLNTKQLTWKRIATGMFQPLGVKVIDEQIFVCCRDQITRLHDLNNDGTVDFYENFNNDHQVTEHFHEFAMDLQTDEKGNFYYAKSARHAKDSLVPHHGTLIRVAPDGSSSEIVCNGFRAANGVGIGPHGELATSDQEGHWTPTNRINLITEDGGFYGNMYSYHQGGQPTDYDRPVVWLPRNVDRSPAEQLWVDSTNWGPLHGKMLSLSYGTGKVFLVIYEQTNGTTQGAAVRMPIATFPTGIMRGRFSPADGQLYACGLFGWSSDRTQPGGFYRIRYTGKSLHIPVDVKATKTGLDITFSHALDAESASDPENYGVKRWNYRWTKNYGSDHYSVENPAKRGEDEVYVENVTLSDDRRTVNLELEVMGPVMQMQVEYSIKANDGQDIRQVFYNTVNALP